MTKEQTVDKDRRTGWLRDLKVGDKVIVILGWNQERVVRMVERLTPSGRITVHAIAYGSSGREMGQDSWSGNHLVRWTEGDEDLIKATQERKSVLNQIRTINFNTVSVATLEQIIFLVKMDAENTAALERVTNS